MEADFDLGRVEDSQNVLYAVQQCSFPCVETGFEFAFEQCKLFGKIAALFENRPHPDKRPDDEKAHLNRGRAIQNRRRHDGAMLGEGARQAPLQSFLKNSAGLLRWSRVLGRTAF
ncbi:MAG TPA: hypothetical protein VG146_19965 [Verrucomicrobiae bacterium]|nr:hypothetical protein [Verrucomicrobiae bacterium]